MSGIRVSIESGTQFMKTALQVALGSAGFQVVERDSSPDVVVMTVRSLECFDGRMSPAAESAVPIVVVHPGAVPASGVLAWGAMGAVVSEDSPDVLAAAVLLAANGVRSGRIDLTHRANVTVDLTDEETKWIVMLSEGTSVTDLANYIGYSRSSTYDRLSALYSKLGAENRTQAVATAVALGLI